MVGLLSLLAKTVLTVFTLYILSCVYNFVRNILLARRTGLKYIVTFVNQDSVPWVCFMSFFLFCAVLCCLWCLVFSLLPLSHFAFFLLRLRLQSHFILTPALLFEFGFIMLPFSTTGIRNK